MKIENFPVNKPKVLFLLTVKLREESLLAVSEAAGGEYFDEGRDDVVSCNTVGLTRVHFLLVAVAQVGVQPPGGHEEVHRKPLVAKYVLVVPVDLVTHL